MSEYYVQHPNIDFSAIIDAPTPEKARTVYLDYMERTGKLNRMRRQSIRENLMTERVHDGETLDADAHLSYYYSGSKSEVTIEPPEMEYESETEPRGEEEGFTEEPSVEYAEPEEEDERGGMSPIGRIATQGY